MLPCVQKYLTQYWELSTQDLRYGKVGGGGLLVALPQNQPSHPPKLS